MEGTLNSFTIVEYLSVFTAFIYGYVATRFFSGWGAMINFRQSIKFSKEHLLWTLLIFGLLIVNWWGSWIKGNFIHQTLLYYISLLPPIFFYLISVLLFPPLSDDRFLDLRNHYYSIRKRNYLVLIGLFVTFLIRALLSEKKNSVFDDLVTISWYIFLISMKLSIPDSMPYNSDRYEDSKKSTLYSFP